LAANHSLVLKEGSNTGFSVGFSRIVRRTLLTGLVAGVSVCAPAAAATGGAPFAVHSYATGGAGAGDTHLPTAKQRAAARARKARAEARRTPVVSGFELSAKTLLDEGRPLTLRYRVKAPAKRVRVRLVVRTVHNTYIKTLQLGVHRTKVLQTTQLTQLELGVLRPGAFKIRLLVNDGKGRKAARAADVKPWLNFTFSDHRFPLAGSFSFGGADARFGVGRPGHIHQGQDVVAAEGTPIVAPHAGTISWVKYQAAGAGYYVVLRSTDGRDYAFMHLQKGSTAVAQGDVVPTGKLLGLVGATGDASGPHLHFEVWIGGPWQLGGHPIDPLPLLKSWYTGGPGGAVQTASASSARVSPLD
jgi:murein DD-endopeptidase MepM/ murein hydrolase activator NlpD